jgi:hypothetical protein
MLSNASPRRSASSIRLSQGQLTVEYLRYKSSCRSTTVTSLFASLYARKHYHSGGNTEFLKIDSECSWTVTVTTA